VIAVVLLLTGFRRARRAWISAGVLVVFAVIGLARFATFGAPGSDGVDRMGGTEPGVGLLLTNIVYLPVYLSGAVGGMALGWNDTPLPPMVFVFGLLALGAIVYRGITDVPRNKMMAALFALAATVAVPLVFLQREGLGVGEVVQARYLLPLMIVLFATLSVPSGYWNPRVAGLPLPRAAAWLIAIATAASASISLWVNAHRYAAGSARGLFDIDLELEWTGLLPVPLPLVVAIGVAATITYVAMATLVVYRDGNRARTSRVSA